MSADDYGAVEILAEGEEKPFHVYMDSRGEWRWRIVAANNQIVGTSGEGYVTREGAVRAVAAVKQLVKES